MKAIIAVVLAAALIACLVLNVVQWRQGRKMEETISSQAAELNQAKKTINTLESQLQSVTPDVLTARTVPIELKTRKAFSGAGLVLIFINAANKPLTLNVRCTSSSFTISIKQFKIDVVSGQLAEIGSEQGWAARKGDKIKVSCSGYDDTTYTIP